MKLVFSITLVILIILTIGAWLFQPNLDIEGKQPLIWSSDDNPARRDQVNLFNQLYPQYDLRLDPTIESIEKTVVQSLAGVGPDLFCCYGTFHLSAAVKSGIALDITDLLTEAGIDIQRDCWRGADSTIIYNNRIYGFPCNAAADAIWYNKAIFDEMKIPYPKGLLSWDEFIELAQKLTIRDKNGKIKQFGFLFSFTSYYHFMVQFGGEIYNETGTKCVIDSPEGIAAIQFMHDLVFKHRVSQSLSDETSMSSEGGWGSGIITWFGGRKGAMALGGRWWLCILRNYKNLHPGVIECPYAKYHVYAGYGKSTIINKHSPRAREAFDFIRYMSGKEYNDLINHQADALAPMKKFCYSDEYLHDPQYPEEDYNEVWLKVMENSKPEEVSPFINGAITGRIIEKQLQMVQANQKSPKEAMISAAKQINDEIQKNVKLDSSLKELYEELIDKEELNIKGRP